MSEALFVVNAGSSSIKFKLYRVVGRDVALILGGALDGIGTRPRLKATDDAGSVLVDRSFDAQEIGKAAQAQHAISDWVTPYLAEHELIGIGHRVVHGGPHYSHPELVNDEVLRTLESFIPLAPLHQLTNLDPIRVIRARRPDLPQVACFDTAFHRGHPEVADRFALPNGLYEDGVRRYGFHGLSYEYVSGALRELAPELARGRVVICHLGSGASACGLLDGRSMESTMGFTALDGLPMGTRCGALDPGVVLHLIEQKGMSPAEVGHMLYHDSGLRGLSGISSDMRELLASEAPSAALAVNYFTLHVAQAVAQLAVSLGGLDALVFTAGIGERSPEIRARVCARLALLGIALDPEANAAGQTFIDADNSIPSVLVIPTDEERMIALATLHLLRGDA
ncbi:acetate/propionate family kinase [Ancylobacter sp. TS-1]|uniref:acetate/propionate family kinase n=1 Tax=Ancylobacter sp. TS-1 TaxID=1850374 RepID=UPI001265CFA6|nr:acetate/propionate family kinase [Ancylobacter sp. TS-1]QFR32704.1 acetate/propionate family kinase [Ancylobacter sp. TS-1]